MEAFANSFVLVALSEMGDKTQLLAFVLALRYRKPAPILAGIFLATILNHALATAVGALAASLVSPDALRYILSATFVAFGLWILVPDKEDEGAGKESRFGPFLTTLFLFFIAEMGDKTQLATVALGARFNDGVQVALGTTFGMMLTNGLAVIFGEKITKVVPLKGIRIAASLLFLAFGVAVFLELA